MPKRGFIMKKILFEKEDKKRASKLFIGAIVFCCVMGAFLALAQYGGKEYSMRTVDTALETYFIDYNAYPDWEYKSYKHLKVPTFKNTSLTTPIGYLQLMPTDTFSFDESYWYSYYSVNDKEKKICGFIIISPGPDRDYDIDPVKDYHPEDTESVKMLINKRYDSTNGTISSGDLFRVKK